jgi:zinc protease
MLRNGMRVITVEDHSSPVVAIAVTYNVGSRNEQPGRTGLAHLFEHLMFKGSENVGPGEHAMLITANGGSLDARTTEDITSYYEVLPSNQLDVLLFLESDRMRSLKITKDGLDNQRKAVQEERRQRIDNKPYGRTDEVHQELLYENFAYKHSVMGSMDDLNAASVDTAQEFFKIYYAPNNAVLALVGDFKTGEALKKMRAYFEEIPPQSNPPPVDMSEPKQASERRATIEDRLARVPQIDIAYKAVPGNSPDFYALDVLSAVLQTGQSSRLYQALVKDKAIAQSLTGYLTEQRGPGGFYTTVTLSPGARVQDAEAVIDAEIERLKNQPVADWELQKAKNIARRSLISRLQSSIQRAALLGEYAIFYDDPNLINTRLGKVAAITREDVERAASHYLKHTNRTVIITLPGGQGPDARKGN